jgi:hypothetical protein
MRSARAAADPIEATSGDDCFSVVIKTTILVDGRRSIRIAIRLHVQNVSTNRKQQLGLNANGV